MDIKAVIFDLDGVIVSTDECHYKAWKMMADEEQIFFDYTINSRLRGVSRMESLEIILEKSTREYSHEEKKLLTDRKNDYYLTYIKELSSKDILPGVMTMINELVKNNIKIAIGSSSKNSPVILERIGLKDFFDATADGNEIKFSKPDPEVFILAASKLGIKQEDCLVVEDADAGVEAAKKAGMRVLAVGSAAKNPKADYSAPNLMDINLEAIYTS